MHVKSLAGWVKSFCNLLGKGGPCHCLDHTLPPTLHFGSLAGRGGLFSPPRPETRSPSHFPNMSRGLHGLFGQQQQLTQTAHTVAII